MVSVCLIVFTSFINIDSNVKEISRILRKKNYGDSAKERYFLRYHNDSINMSVNTNEEN